MNGKSIVIYDLEIIKGIHKKGEEKHADIEYCNGWRDFENMGISVAGAYDYMEDRYRVFCKDNMKEFKLLLNNRDVVVDFNGTQFDKPLLMANGITFPHTCHYDILREIWIADGLDPDRFNFNTHGGYGLDACCKVNFGTEKTGNGALAPVEWQRGNIGNVIDYCLNDIRLTKQLLDKIMEDGNIISPRSRTGKTISMRSVEYPF